MMRVQGPTEREEDADRKLVKKNEGLSRGRTTGAKEGRRMDVEGQSTQC